MNRQIKTIMKQNGFSLVELMIVLAVGSILMFVAYPAYQASVIDSKRADAQAALVSFSASMEKHFSTNNSYLGAATGGNNTGVPTVFASGTPVDSTKKIYNLTIAAATATSYTLRATPLDGQTSDGILQLTSVGQKQWDKNNDGSIGTGEYTWTK